MAESVTTEFEVLRREGRVQMMMFDDDDTLTVVSLELEDAAALGDALLNKALQANDDPGVGEQQ